jgi:hypothetical protein
MATTPFLCGAYSCIWACIRQLVILSAICDIRLFRALNYTAHYHKASNSTGETTSNAVHRHHSCMLGTPAGKFITPLLAFISLRSDAIFTMSGWIYRYAKTINTVSCLALHHVDSSFLARCKYMLRCYRNLPRLMKHEASLLWSSEIATGLYPQPHDFRLSSRAIIQFIPSYNYVLELRNSGGWGNNILRIV